MKLIINEFVSASLMSTIVTVLVLLNIPFENYDKTNYKKRPLTIGIKTFIVSFVTTFVIFYFISDPPKADVMKNIIQTEPDF
jgi:hypothetical protein